MGGDAMTIYFVVTDSREWKSIYLSKTFWKEGLGERGGGGVKWPRRRVVMDGMGLEIGRR